MKECGKCKELLVEDITRISGFFCPTCSKERQVENASSKRVDHIEALTKDLVKLALLSNKVIIEGSFSGRISDEVANVLKMCQEIHDTYITKEKQDE